MTVENKILDCLECANLIEGEELIIRNSIIKRIDFDIFVFSGKVLVERCIIEDFKIHATWFKEGLVFRNNLVSNYIDYQCGGHNDKPIVLEGNVFSGFFNFFDCQFDSVLLVKNNVFLQGSNLLGNENEGFRNLFENGHVVENNMGTLNRGGMGIFEEPNFEK